MSRMLARLVATLHSIVRTPGDDRGSTATEYAFLVAFIALALIIGITFFGSALNTWFTQLASHVGFTS